MFKRSIAKKTIAFLLLFTLAVIGIIPTTTAEAAISSPKYVFYFIGDGLGSAQRMIAEYYMQEKTGDSKYKLTMNKLPVFGINTTYSSNSLVTDSAAAGTALACGYKTNSGMISVLPDGKTKVKSVIECAEEKGMGTGIITTTRVTHATPAVFAAHNVSRDDENAIAEDMINSGVDFLVGGGLRNFVPKSFKYSSSKRNDERNLLAEVAGTYNLFLLDGKDSFLKFQPKGEKKVIGLFSSSHIPYEVDRINQNLNVPTLAQMTSKGIDVLSQYKNGFFMMVEGGRIDHACHANDAQGAILDTIAFDDAIKVAYDFYLKHPKETLIVVVGDHETGGLGMGFANNYFLKLNELFDVKASIEDMVSYGKLAYKANADRTEYFKMLETTLGLDNLTATERAEIEKAMDLIDKGSKSDYVYGGYNQVAIAATHVVSERANIQWTTYAHSGTAIPMSAIGVRATEFGGYKDNAEIGNTMAKVMGFKLGIMK